MGTYNNICPRLPTNYPHQPSWQQHSEPLNGLISLHKLAQSLISSSQTYAMPLNATWSHCLFITIISGPLVMEKKKGGREEKRNKDTEKCKTGGENWQCGSISDSPLPLSYQSHWLVHVILLWFGLANQWTADRLPVTVQPLKWRWKSHSFIHFTPVRAFFYTSKNLLFLHSHSKRCFSSHCSHWLSGYKRWCKIIQKTVDEFLKWRCHILQILVSFISEQLLLSKYWHFSHIHKVPSLIECIIS